MAGREKDLAGKGGRPDFWANVRTTQPENERRLKRGINNGVKGSRASRISVAGRLKGEAPCTARNRLNYAGEGALLRVL